MSPPQARTVNEACGYTWQNDLTLRLEKFASIWRIRTGSATQSCIETLKLQITKYARVSKGAKRISICTHW